MRMVALGMVLLVVGCNNGTSGITGSGGSKAKPKTELDKWQGEWINADGYRYLKLKVKGTTVDADFGDDDTVKDFTPSEWSRMMRLRLLPKDAFGKYPGFDFIHNGKENYLGVYLFHDDGTLEISILDGPPRPNDISGPTILLKRPNR